MAKVWVLDTSTKGTGATMVPLDSVLRKPGGNAGPTFVLPPPVPKQPEPERPRGPRRFRIVDVSSREVLAEDVPARAAIELLSGVRSIVDVAIYVLDPEKASWRLLTLDEQRLLWSNRAAAQATATRPSTG